MVLFVCDLDHTLFHPFSESSPTDICVETRKKAPVTFMSAASHQMLARLLPQLSFVPCTTRTLEQYNRIHLFKQAKYRPPYALVNNGAVLLIQGKVDLAWQKQSDAFASEARAQMYAARQALSADRYRTHSIHRISQNLYFTRSRQPKRTVRHLLAHIDTKQIAVQQKESYIYLTPQTLTKGFALKRLFAMQPFSYVVGAGDSLFDVSMLRLSDCCYVPNLEFIQRYLQDHPHTYFLDETDASFSDMILSSLLQRFERGEFQK